MTGDDEFVTASHVPAEAGLECLLEHALTWSLLDAVKPFANLNDAGSWKTA